MKQFPLFSLLDIVYACDLLEGEGAIDSPNAKLTQSIEEYSLDFLCEAKELEDLMSQRLSSMISSLEFMKKK